MDETNERPLVMVTLGLVSSAVLYDGETRAWFRRLLASSGARKKLAGLPGEAPRRFRCYRAWQGASVLLWLAAFAAAVLVVRAPVTETVALAGAGVLLVAFAMVAAYFERQALAAVAARFVEPDLADFPAGMTMYQMGEIYAARYRVPSLVDVIWIENQWLRNAAPAIYFATLGVYFLPFAQMLAWIGIGCLAVLLAAKVYAFVCRPA